MSTDQPPVKARYLGFWKRLLARLLDLLFVGVPGSMSSMAQAVREELFEGAANVIQ